MHVSAQKCLLHRDAPAVKLVEIVAIKGKPLTLLFTDNTAEELLVDVDIAQAVDKLSKAVSCGEKLRTYNYSPLELHANKRLCAHCDKGNELCQPIDSCEHYHCVQCPTSVPSSPSGE